MPEYISLSMSQKLSVLSPTSAWSWLSQYAMVRSEKRRLSSVCTSAPMSQACPYPHPHPHPHPYPHPYPHPCTCTLNTSIAAEAGE